MNDEFEFPVGARVELKGEVEDLYAFAISGTRATVRDRKKDRDGFKLVQIEWDKDHWRYQGEPDMWTFENHFRLAAQVPQPEAQEEVPEGELCPHCGQIHPMISEEEMTKHHAYWEHLADAFSTAHESDAFLVIAINTFPHPTDENVTAIQPMVFIHSLNPEAGAVLEYQVHELAKLVRPEQIDAMRRKLGGWSETPDP